MTSLPTQELTAAVLALKKSVAAAAAQPHPPGRLIRAAAPAAPVSPPDWLAAQSGSTQYYWSDRHGAFEMAGIGEGDAVSPANGPEGWPALFTLLRDRLPAGQSPARYYGGFRFQPRHGRASRWRDFSGYRFVAPLIELHRHRGATTLSANLMADGGGGVRDAAERALAALDRMSLEPAQKPAAPQSHTREDRPDREEWEAMVRRALDAFADGALRKVVLARETRFVTDTALDPVAVLRRLIRNTRHSFCFCFHPAEDRAFLGASPERLFRRAGNLLESEALAGTCGRDPDPAADAALAAGLLSSEKDRREQAMVADALRELFGHWCGTVTMDPEPALLTLLHCRHLLTRISGTLRGPADDAALLAALHPTPAVGGVPRRAALDWIAREEPFDRGLYAAPVGWIAADSAEFCVAIRSGLVKGNTLTVYNGAGIVPGSEPAAEWREIETKMRNFIRVLRHDGTRHGT
ncbi:MAG: isochorismate synthase [Candidatus Hydrogenedens sp.]|nr:isochorismate synthase [Candidatus Hydrogenedens sp.]